MPDGDVTWSLGRFNPNHAPPGAGGGQFASASGSKGGKKAAPDAHQAHMAHLASHPVARGERGKRVSDLQDRLNALGAKPPLASDGIFGPKTLAAVKAFQRAHGLKPNGLVGPKTTAALEGAPAAPKPKAPAHHRAPAHHAAAVQQAARAGGAVTNPKGTERLHQYWVHGEGAAKIAWGAPGDFDRCVAELGKYIHDPQGYCAKAHHDALGYYPATHAKMEHAGRADMAADEKPHGDNGAPASRTVLRDWEPRPFPLEDVRILTRAEGYGSGTVVEAYATVFDQSAEIRDGQGHYMEVIDRTAFDATLSRLARQPGGLSRAVKVLYNHGKTAEGAPAPEFQVPIGVPLDIRPEARGLLTRTDFDASDPFTERILSKVKSGAINAYSFVGSIMRSDPDLRGPGDRHRARNGALTTVRRMALGLREYGPVLWPAYSGAEILGVRMSIPGSLDEPGCTEDEEYSPADEGDVAGGIPEEVHPSRMNAHRLWHNRLDEACREAGIVLPGRG